MATLRQLSGEAGPTLPTRGNGSNQHTLTTRIAGGTWAELFNHPNRFITNDEARFLPDILPRTICKSVPQIVVKVTRITTSPTTCLWSFDLLNPDIVHAVKHRSTHGFHAGTSSASGPDSEQRLELCCSMLRASNAARAPRTRRFAIAHTQRQWLFMLKDFFTFTPQPRHSAAPTSSYPRGASAPRVTSAQPELARCASAPTTSATFRDTWRTCSSDG